MKNYSEYWILKFFLSFWAVSSVKEIKTFERLKNGRDYHDRWGKALLSWQFFIGSEVYNFIKRKATKRDRRIFLGSVWLYEDRRKEAQNPDKLFENGI